MRRKHDNTIKLELTNILRSQGPISPTTYILRTFSLLFQKNFHVFFFKLVSNRTSDLAKPKGKGSDKGETSKYTYKQTNRLYTTGSK